MNSTDIENNTEKDFSIAMAAELFSLFACQKKCCKKYKRKGKRCKSCPGK